jgi:hypothetical protein
VKHERDYAADRKPGKVKFQTDPADDHSDLPKTIQTPSLRKEVYLVGELPDWLAEGLKNAKYGDGPK